jgi:hypothetical protein
MKNLFIDHPRDTANPQTYWQHGAFAFKNSVVVTLGGIVGIIHAIFPWWFKFTTSTIVINSFKKLIDSGRHKAELQKIMPRGYVHKKHLD